MRVVVFGANGVLGQWVWKAALAAGHQVVAFVRSPEKLDRATPGFEKLEVLVGDVMDAVAVRSACRGSDCVINCTSPSGGNATIDLAQSVVSNASASGVGTCYMIGGMGALWVPGSNKSLLLQDWDDIEGMAKYGLPPLPREKVQQMTKGHLASMEFMATTNLDYCYICPGVMIEDAATTARVVTLDELGGTSLMRVNAGDVAQVIVDDLEAGELIGHRVCVSAA